MNYIIAGTSRCGKTMLTNKIVKELHGFSKISIDNIIKTFENTMPQLDIGFHVGKGNQQLLPSFIEELLIGAMDKDNDIGLYYIIEGDGIPFSKLLELNENINIELIFLGKPRLSVQEYFEEIRYYEGKYLYSEWTKNLTDEMLRLNCKNWIDKSKEYQKLCEENSIRFYDTSYHQEFVINTVFEEIKQEITNFQE